MQRGFHNALAASCIILPYYRIMLHQEIDFFLSNQSFFHKTKFSRTKLLCANSGIKPEG